MKKGRYTIIFVGLSTLLFVITTADDYSWGIKHHDDILLDRKYIKHNGKWFRWTTVNYEFPQEGKINYNVITHVAITDQKPEDYGGYATITGGGVGSNYVDIEFKSRWNAGFDFIVEIYGHADDKSKNNYK